MTTTQKTMRRTALLFAAALLALVVSSGVALAVTKSCEAGVQCFGTTQADTLNGSLGNDFIYGRESGDTLNGFGGGDFLYGQGGADKLFDSDGVGPDYFVGGPGNDALSGDKEGPDAYYFGPSWGKDTITDNATDGNQVVFLQGPAPDEQMPVSDDLTIKLVPGTGPEVTNASGTSTVSWVGTNVIKNVYSGSGDDHIMGNFAPNYISVKTGGADNISAGGGNDLIYVSDGLGDDMVVCGETVLNTSDTDTVYFDSGDQIASNCEAKYGPS